MSAFRLPPLASVKELLKIYKLRALKQLSQNFLLDEKVCNKIVKAAGGVRFLENAEVCEVGPGPGPITRSIINAGVKKLIVLEKDARFLPPLELLADACNGRMEIIIGDVLSYDMSKSFSTPKSDWDSSPPLIHLIGNLPFSVATPLIIKWLRDISCRQNAWVYGRVPMTLTFQQEVAERMAAKEESKQRCRLSVMCQAWCDTRFRFTIKGSAFVPQPDVDVGVVRLIPLKQPLITVPFPVAEKLVRQVFSMRQKYCRAGASTLFPVLIREEYTENLFVRSGVNPQTRPFQLTMSEFSALADVYWEFCQEDPRLFEYNHRAALCDRNEAQWQQQTDELIEDQELDDTSNELYEKLNI